MIKLTKSELSHYNGTDNNPGYIAYNGKIYNITDSFLWKKGKHQVLHTAGEDLTEALKEAPHGEDLLDRVPVIGELIE
ncbi:MAG: hypothetical protein JXB88_27015 [Spirochaetales bacterium]|nr:hypothetical protein [Spirochaetales bacterium]